MDLIIRLVEDWVMAEQSEFRYTTGDTIWGCNSARESPMQGNVQIDIGYDATDIWMVFNTSTNAVQLTHERCRDLIKGLEAALAAAPAPEQKEEKDGEV